MRPHGFPAALRLKKRREFLGVQNQGKKVHLRSFLVFLTARPIKPPATSADPPATRLGITVTRKIGKAVTRNRIKRLVREVFVASAWTFERLGHGLGREAGAAAVSYAEVVQDMEALIERAAGARR